MDISDNNMMIAMNATLCYTAQSGNLSLKFIHCYRLATSRPSRGIFKRRSRERERHKSQKVDLFHFQGCESGREILAQKT